MLDSLMKFPYVIAWGFFMPLIPVRLRRGDSSVQAEALVDSGAASCIFNAQFAAALGIANVEEGAKVQFQGISGNPLDGYLHSVTLEIGGNRFHNVEIAFSRAMPDNAANILGQEGFFDLFPVKFTRRKREIELMASTSH